MTFEEKLFTIHFATINTLVTKYIPNGIALFTIHFATINTLVLLLSLLPFSHLQYTLLLLIQTKLDQLKNNINNLQYTLLLLIRKRLRPFLRIIINLQYTLLLLIRRKKNAIL